jgi:hypothetical protein
MSLADLVDLLNVELEKLPETILKRIELALSEGRYKREEILEFIRRVIECYLY